jgi:hypothetical protein
VIPSVLLSYHWWRRHDVDRLLDAMPVRPWVYADSGAFSAQAALGGKSDLEPVTVEGYIGWLDEHRDRIDACVSMDIYGDLDTSKANTEAIAAAGHLVTPVFHVGEPWEWLDYWCEHYPYVGLGGMVPWSTNHRALMRWLIRCMRVAREHGVVVHALGQTNTKMLAALPFYSCDSSSWVAFQRFGGLMLWDDAVQRLIPVNKGAVTPRGASLLRRCGVDPARYGEPHYGRGAVGPRAVEAGANVGRTAQQANAERTGLRVASLWSWLHVQEWMRRRHGDVLLEDAAPGPHVCIVCVNPTDLVDLSSAITLYEQELSVA